MERIITLASLAHHRALTSLDDLTLARNLYPVPPEHIKSLVSIVTGEVHLRDVKNCDLVSLFGSINCDQLKLDGVETTEAEIEALVEALRFRTRKLIIYEIRLLKREEIDKLTQYRGDGVCESILFTYEFIYVYDEEEADIKIEDIKSWGAAINWKVDQTKAEDEWELEIYKPM